MKKILIGIIVFSITTFADAAWLTGDGIRIAGRVTDASGNPLAGASVSIEGSFTGVHTAADGYYSITGLVNGSYSVSFSFVGYEKQTFKLDLTGDEVLDVSLSQKTLITDEVIIKATRAGDNYPLAYTNIGGELLEKQNAGQDIPFLLGLTPSLVETSEAGNGIGYTSLRIRGTDGSRINVTIDGIPLNDPESQQVFWVDIPDLASSVDNIQVQRGVGTSSNGAGAFGASVNIQTKGIGKEPFAEINSSAGSFNTFKNSIAAGTGFLDNKFAFQMRYSDLRSDGYIKRTGSEHRSAFFSGIYRGKRSLLKANIILGNEHTGIGWWGVPGEMLEIDRRYNPAGEYSDENGLTKYYDNESDNYTQNHYQLIYNLKLNDGFSLHSALHYTKGKGYYEEYKEDRQLSEYGLSPVIIGGTTINETDLIRRKWMSNDFYGLVYSLNYGKKNIEASIGGGINLFSGDHYGRIIWMQNSGTTAKDHQWYFNNGEKGEINMFGKISYSISARTSVFGDMQYRHINYDLDGIDDDLKVIEQEHRFGFFNPKAGVFLKISDDQEAYLSFSVAHREPTRTDFKEASGDETATPRAERLFDTEMGYKLRLERCSFAVNLYGMIYKDQLVPTGELSNVGYSIMTNVERSYRTGIEISAGLIPVDFVTWNLNLTLSRNRISDFTEYYTDYNTTDWSSEYKSKNLGEVDIAYSPSVIGSSDLSFSLIPELILHLTGKYVGKQYFDNTMDKERMLDPYFINNFRVDFKPAIKNIREMELQLLVNNIFDARYESNAYGGNWFEDGAEKSWSYYFPQAGINFLIKLGLKF